MYSGTGENNGKQREELKNVHFRYTNVRNEMQREGKTRARVIKNVI